MKKKLLLAVFAIAIFAFAFGICVSAAAPLPQKPDLGVDFGTVTKIDGFTAPSELYVNTDERVLLVATVDDQEVYTTYPTYYVTKDSTTFDFDFSKLNEALDGTSYGKANVVMLEIPDGITTISNNYFTGQDYTFSRCLSVQVPGSVTSYGSSMFIKNDVVRIVEFLDGETPVTMGNQMFGSNATGRDWGATNVEYVKFPNNLVSIGQNTFGKSHANKVIILGENLKSIGAGFLNQSTPEDKDTFIYAPASFFENVTMFSNFFGGYDQWHHNLLKITLFYTGSKDDAEALVAKGLAVQTGYVWSNAKYVSANDFVYATDRATARSSISIVYDYNKCDAFYGSAHDEQVLNGCQFGCSRNCGKFTLRENPVHDYAKSVLYGESKDVNYFANISVCESCINCKTSKGEPTKIDALFSDKGYSVSLDGIGIVYSFYINKDAIAEYKALVSSEFEYGLVASSQEGELLAVDEANKVVPNNGSAVCAAIEDPSYKLLEIKVVGFGEDDVDASIVCCGYVRDGEKIYYLSEGATASTASGKTYNSLKSE